MNIVLPLDLESLVCELQTLPRVDSTFFNDLSVQCPRLRGRVGRRFRVDPETVDTGFIPAATILICLVGFQNDVFVCDFDVLAVCEVDVEIVQSSSVQHEDAVAFLADIALSQLADEHAAFDSALLPLSCGRAEDVDDRVGREGKNRADGGVVPAEDRQVELLIGARGRQRHGLHLLLLVIGAVIGVVRFIVRSLDGGRLLEGVVVAVVIVLIGTTFAGFTRSHCEGQRERERERDL